MSGSNDHIGGEARRYGNATIGEAVARLRAGGLVAVPTETVYGLAADSTNAAAVAEIYRTKGRPDFNPLIVHVPDRESAGKLGKFDDLASLFADALWPGPLTIVVPKRDNCPVAAAVTAGLETIALRCPAHPVMRELLEQSGLYLAAPSANRSGGISPTTAEHVTRSLGAKVPLILDGGPCERGIESTIIAVAGGEYRILRPGPVTEAQLEAVAGKAPILADTNLIEAPGQMLSHYAPSKPLRLNAETAADDEYHIGFGNLPGDRNLSPDADLAEAASLLFAALHDADASGKPRIAVAPIPNAGIGNALNDRLRRAASPR
ncbi:L-threonylcarbamoyladenylate synthase [Sphingorhabdus sp. YGSMI21]|uniref:L-threonylcarbamoyladenylate synthase n=1 Tax=Sphingorhabdus sp. YGSMI21 TaxID=2077182 RepID=UPI000C1DCC8F|nr:L-threonylcarbamoyladenylate synthase [Sphingorhabdus sp. YGSMI21]ATW02754.1 threonylcarbamoyl-AMP synthase [Sphingorhabdus sp. YGSMI21]